MKTHTEAKPRTPSRTHTAPVPNALKHQAQLRNALLRAGVQPRLEIGAVNDPLEREADAVAERVLRMPEPLREPLVSSVRAELVEGQMTHQQGLRQAQPERLEVAQSFPRGKAAGGEGNLIQTKASPAPTATKASPQLKSSLNSLNSGGTPLDASTRSFFEPRFAQDFSQVRLHTDTNAAQMADSLNAKAFTLGNDIAFGANQYSANTPAGKNLLGHELVHVVQQRGMGGGALQVKWVQRQSVDKQHLPDQDLEKWKDGINKADERWDRWDDLIQYAVNVYNARFSGIAGYTPLEWEVIKAMLWSESGPHSDAWETKPMQIGNTGDAGLRALLSGNEGGDLILPPWLKKTLSKDPTGAFNIFAGIGYLLMRMANFQYQNVVDFDPDGCKDSENGEITVGQNDNLWKIAKRVGSTADVLKNLNGLKDEDEKFLKPGKVLKCRKASVQRVIVGWKNITPESIAKYYNGGGDSRYSVKLNYALAAIHNRIIMPPLNGGEADHDELNEVGNTITMPPLR